MNAERVYVEIPVTPPSLNSWLSKHWRVRAREKSNLETELAVALSGKMPDTERVVAFLSIRFPDKRRRDVGNFSATLEKCLGDVLVTRGYLADDDHRRFHVVSAEIEPEAGAPRTRIELDCYVDLDRSAA